MTFGQQYCNSEEPRLVFFEFSIGIVTSNNQLWSFKPPTQPHSHQTK